MSNKSAESLADEKGVESNTVHHSGSVDSSAMAIKRSSWHILRSWTKNLTSLQCYWQLCEVVLPAAVHYFHCSGRADV